MNKKRNDMKICIIYNYAQHYRLAIFQLLNKNLNCDFYFGDKMKDIKKLDYNLLPGFKSELKNIKIYSNFYWQKGAVSLFFKKYDTYIILGEYYCLSTWIMLILGRFSRKKIYLWSHAWYGNETVVKRLIKKIFFKLSDQIFLYGNYAKELMLKEGFKAERLHVINNSLYYSEQLIIRNQLKISSIYKNFFDNDDPVIVFIGRLTKEKKLDMLMEAQNILIRENILVNLVFIGIGEEEGFLKSKIVDRATTSCWFFGACYDELKIGELIYNANVCVSPGNVGLTAMHSMVFGTPVITHNDFPTQMPEFEAIIAGKTGDFFMRDNVNDLAFVIKRWISPTVNREEVRRECYKEIDENYNPVFQLSVFEKVINSDNL